MTDMKNILCIYHGNCADGFGAAWIVRKALGDSNVEFIPGVYQNDPPDCTNRHVIMVDFSYKRPTLLKILRECTTLTIIDHHKTTRQEINGLYEDIYYESMLSGKLSVSFDIHRSGAGLTWDYYFKNKRPPLINYVEDRDLWRFNLHNSREINAAIFSYGYDFNVWDMLMEMDLDRLTIEGVGIERKHHKDVAELVNVTRREMKIGTEIIPVANLPYTLTSDAGHLMATGHASRMAACYWDTPEGRVFSLRSTDDGPDVSEIAKKYGGGGHARAAGFRVSIGWEGEPI